MVRRIGRWLVATNGSPVTTAAEARRDSWIVSSAACVLVGLTLSDLPAHGWAFYLRGLGGLLLVGSSIRSWREYRRLRSVEPPSG